MSEVRESALGTATPKRKRTLGAGRGILTLGAPALYCQEEDGWTSISPHLTTTKCHVA
jgi:hypothetical protein